MCSAFIETLAALTFVLTGVIVLQGLALGLLIADRPPKGPRSNAEKRAERFLSKPTGRF